MERKGACLKLYLRGRKPHVGHEVRGGGLLKLIVEGRIEGRRPNGWLSMGMIDNSMMGSYD